MYTYTLELSVIAAAVAAMLGAPAKPISSVICNCKPLSAAMRCERSVLMPSSTAVEAVSAAAVAVVAAPSACAA